MATRRPNVLLITTDQQRYDALGINGNRILRTPNLDHLAAGGTNFSRCYITCPVCIPARRTLLTGMHPETHGLTRYQDGVDFDPPATLPGKLREVGYQTQLVGKLHIHPQRKRFGFDHMVLSDSSHDRPNSGVQEHNDYVTWLRERGMPHHSTSHGIAGNGRVARPWTLNEELHHSSWVAEQAARFFDTTRDPSMPWFLHVSFVAPHPPLIPPEAYWEIYRDRQDLRPVVAEWAPQGKPRPGTAPDSANGPFEPEDIRRAIAGYYGLINHIDDRVAYLLERFFEYHNPRAQEPTYILFSSDHGEMLGDHHLFRKSLPYESSTHVPFFISGRNVDVPRGTCDALCCWEDIMPTILDLVGVPEEPRRNEIDGRSLLPAMRGEAPAREAVHGLCMGAAPHRYVVVGRHKYVWFTKTNEEQVFDVIGDPHEMRDLSADASILNPLRDRMAPAAAAGGMSYDRAALRPCANKTPVALGFPMQ